MPDVTGMKLSAASVILADNDIIFSAEAIEPPRGRKEDGEIGPERVLRQELMKDGSVKLIVCRV